jgi:hypothetical protein
VIDSIACDTIKSHDNTMVALTAIKKCLSTAAEAKSSTTNQATTCMPRTNAAMPSATPRRRDALPAVIIATKSRQARRDSWRANQTAVPGWIMGLRGRHSGAREARARNP